MNVLLGTMYIEKYTQCVFPMEREIVPEHSAPVALLGKGTKANVTKILSREVPTNEQNEHARARVAKFITISVETE